MGHQKDKLPHKNIEWLYRYREEQVEEFWNDQPSEAALSMRLYLHTYRVLKHTPCGCWIDLRMNMRKFINLTANKKWACPTLEEAMESFMARKKRQVHILRNQLLRAEASLHLNSAKALPPHFTFHREPHEPY
jgi:GR25 family glycosyltransferase involved in LPS biosynthesis